MIMSKIDPRVEAARIHWSGRFVTKGVPLSVFQDVTETVKHWDQWCSTWSEKAKIFEDLGHQAKDQGYSLSAAQHLTTAAVCYHFGKFLFVQDPEQMKIAHVRAVECRNLALPFLDPPGERVNIPHGEHSFYGNLRKPAGIKKPPVILMTLGLDSAKEEMDTNEKIFLERGMATLVFDGPGQGESEYEQPICPEYEVPVKSVMNWLEERNDVDSDRVGIWGVSLGGYYAPRAAAFEERIKACISLTGPFKLIECFNELPGLTKTAFIHRSHSSDEEHAKEVAVRMSLEDVAEKITCPLYVVAGKLDRVIPYQQALKLSQTASGEVVLNLVEDGGHVANNRAYKYRTQSADWIASRLGV